MKNKNKRACVAFALCFLLTGCTAATSSSSSSAASSSSSTIDYTTYERKAEYMTAFDNNLFARNDSFTLGHSFDGDAQSFVNCSEMASAYMKIQVSSLSGGKAETYYLDYKPYAGDTSSVASDYKESINACEALMANSWKDGEWGDTLPSDDHEGKNVSDSEQLWYAFQCGYKPIIDSSNTTLTTLYNKIREVVKSVTSPVYTDYQKMVACYDWIGSHTLYDHDAVSKNAGYEADCYYLEGVFNRGLAVCDGLSKALVVMGNLLGVRTKRVDGTKSKVGHAWNYVNIDDKWYVIDPTAADTGISFKDVTNKMEMANHLQLLTNNDYLSELGYNQVSYQTYAAADTNDFYFTGAQYNFEGKTVTNVAKKDTDMDVFYRILNKNLSGARFIQFKVDFDVASDEDFKSKLSEMVARHPEISTTNFKYIRNGGGPCTFLYYA